MTTHRDVLVLPAASERSETAWYAARPPSLGCRRRGGKEWEGKMESRRRGGQTRDFDRSRGRLNLTVMFLKKRCREDAHRSYRQGAFALERAETTQREAKSRKRRSAACPLTCCSSASSFCFSSERPSRSACAMRLFSSCTYAIAAALSKRKKERRGFSIRKRALSLS